MAQFRRAGSGESHVRHPHKESGTQRDGRGVRGHRIPFCRPDREGRQGDLVRQREGEAKRQLPYAPRRQHPHSRQYGVSAPLVGIYLAEPVYVADIPHIQNGSYVPRICPNQKDQVPRTMWPELAVPLQEQKPLVLFPGQLLKVNGVLCRYKGFSISGNKWVLQDPRKSFSEGDPLKGFPISSIAKPEDLQLINEDILGECFKDLEASEE